MPLTEKGNEIMRAMKKQYGSERGEQVFYASKNKGTISGVDKMPSFRQAVRDAANAGLAAKDAVATALGARAEANLAKGGDFLTQVRKASEDGLSARDAIAFALDYGVKGMKRGIRQQTASSGSNRMPASVSAERKAALKSAGQYVGRPKTGNLQVSQMARVHAPGTEHHGKTGIVSHVSENGEHTLGGVGTFHRKQLRAINL